MYVYQFLATDDRVIYVGKTNDMDIRMPCHKSTSPWYKEHDSIIFADLHNRTVAGMYETYLINKLMPEYNISDKRGHDVGLISFDEDKISWVKYTYKVKPNPKPKIKSRLYCQETPWFSTTEVRCNNDKVLNFLSENIDDLKDTFFNDNGFLNLKFGNKAHKKYQELTKNGKGFNFIAGDYIVILGTRCSVENHPDAYVSFSLNDGLTRQQCSDEVYHEEIAKLHRVIDFDSLSVDRYERPKIIMRGKLD